MKVCCRCHTKHKGPKATCSRCLAWFKERRAAKAASGLCGFNACRAPSALGKKMCEEHLEYFRRRKASKVLVSKSDTLNDFDSVL